MIVDSSALIAVARFEDDADQFAAVMDRADRLSMSAASWLEAAIVFDRARDREIERSFDELIRMFDIQIVPFTAEQAQIARQAYRRYGKGAASGARLNFGDCISYALAKAKDEPLLFKGDDFPQTDIVSGLR